MTRELLSSLDVLQSFDRNAGHQKTLIKCRCSSKKWFCTNEKTRTAKRMRLVLLAREPESFWRGNALAVVVLLRVLARNVVVAKISYLAINEWARLSRIWRIKQIEEGVMYRGRRPRWITSSEICLIFHILRKPNSLIALLFIQNNS